MLKHLVLASGLAVMVHAPPLWAQTAETATPAVAAAPDPGFTTAELEKMVGPVALYPDTLLMQILVASTVPLDVMKANQYLQNNPEISDEDRKTYAEAQDWDESVQVLTSAFPDVLSDMANHVDWTESIGNAMLTQSNDVMTAVQTMRKRAMENGTLVSGSEQKIEVVPAAASTTTTTSATATPVPATAAAPAETVVITPTNPERVYVPQYDTNTVYSNNLGNVVATTAVAFGTAALIDSIFDDDDHWGNYWGCRDCGGWNGQPIVRQPNIDLDVDGNVRIGNQVNIDRDKIGWKPDRNKADAARSRVQQHRNADGSTRLQVNKNRSAQDNLRERAGNLQAGGGPDGARAALASGAAKRKPDHSAQFDRPSNFSQSDKAAALNRTKGKASHARPSGGKPAVKKATATHKKPAVQRASKPTRPNVQKGATKHPAAMKRQASGAHTKKASNRGHASRKHGR